MLEVTIIARPRGMGVRSAASKILSGGMVVVTLRPLGCV
jgi:hypothetical protein